jgi:glycerophosphoryl diester phosphodiesterase
MRPVQPAVVAHRGASTHRPEHTLGAYALALEQGADGLECDVRLTRDGHLVCVHDRRVDRTSSGRGVVSTLSLADLSTLDYSSWHDGPLDHADDLVLTHRTAGRGAPERLLTLEALIGLVTAHPGTKLFVETKHPVRYAGLVETKLVALLRRFGLANPQSKEDSPIVVMSFSARAVNRVRLISATLPTVWLIGLLGRRRRNDPPRGADYVGPGIDLLRADPGFVARSAAVGRDTYCWTVDEPADVLLCQRLGVRFLATNTPAATRAVLDRGGSG